ncbi:glycosyltransferase family 2 protein [Emticicia sp. TH156]|uniref:glycosyltransferase family 2 protein n=1 Tax=Emticicia sp. TH156 TaxID=2067454 RepID=UPI000C76DB5D|nr:glycosyltransferase family 2 protein [Emticicia sp. TH156]PLK44290.1 dTDP-Rha--alpha-D-GlcNAc-pyrophosphate polyprenol alpha-3-L-rhamnosyltransferase [Emticicia sp. TH156]
MSKVAIVILNYNGQGFLGEFLPSVIKHAEGYEIVVADNASTDNSLVFMRHNYPQIRLISLPVNTGFAGGYNEALAQIEADYYVLLNSDVEVTPNWVAPVVELLDANPAIAACQPKLKDYNNRQQFEYAGAAGGYIDWLGYPFCRGRIFDTCEADNGQYDDTREVFWATGACMFVRASVFHELGGFDTSFFAHMEEIDLCWRMKNAGYQVYYSAASTVYHVGGGTLHKSNPRKTFLNYRNGLAMMYKNLPQGRLFSTIFLRLILDGVSGIKLFLGGSFKDVRAIIRAHFAFYGMIRNLERKSPKVLKDVYPKSIVLAYFLKKKKTYGEL